MRISLLADGRVEAHAPEGTDAEAVVRAVRQRARWIWQQLDAWRARRVHVLPRAYVSGESHFFLGRRHVLKVRVAADAVPGVKLLRGRLDVTAPDARADTVRALLRGWYQTRAAEVFARRLALLAGQTGWLTAPPDMRLLNMRTQWGSCSPGGLLILNPALVKAPGPCIDYVLGHELCHLREHNHGDRFHALLERLVPDTTASPSAPHPRTSATKATPSCVPHAKPLASRSACRRTGDRPGTMAGKPIWTATFASANAFRRRG